WTVGFRRRNRDYQNTLGVVHYRLGEYPQALQTLQDNVQQGRGLVAAYDGYFLAMTYQGLGQPDKARGSYSHAARLPHASTPSPRESALLDAIQTEVETVLAEPPAPER